MYENDHKACDGTQIVQKYNSFCFHKAFFQLLEAVFG